MKYTSPLLVLLMMGCSDIFEYSPNQEYNNDSPRNVNLSSFKRLQPPKKQDTVTIVFLGDSQRFYEETEDFVDKVNQLDGIDFVMIGGDVSDFGLLQELEWVHERLAKLKVPYFAVVGNHDVVGNGNATFAAFYGPLNYSFTYGAYKFVLHNTNGREYVEGGVPDMQWLRAELEDPNATYTVPVSHVAPFSGDFNQRLEEPYAQLLREQDNLVVSLHAHQHSFSDRYFYNDGVRYINSAHFEARELLKLTFVQQNVILEKIRF